MLLASRCTCAYINASCPSVSASMAKLSQFAKPKSIARSLLPQTDTTCTAATDSPTCWAWGPAFERPRDPQKASLSRSNPASCRLKQSAKAVSTHLASHPPEREAASGPWLEPALALEASALALKSCSWVLCVRRHIIAGSSAGARLLLLPHQRELSAWQLVVGQC